MNVVLLFAGFVLCVWGVIRGIARTRQWTPHSTVAVALFWSSAIGCLSAAAVVVATILLVAAFDENKDMNPAFPQAWGFTVSSMRVSSGASLLFHLLLFFIPSHGAATKPNVA